MEPHQPTDPWGIDSEYLDVKGQVHPISPGTREALLRSMGVEFPPDPSSAPDWAGGAYSDVIVLRGATPWTPHGPGILELEDGTLRTVKADDANQLPLGYHTFKADGRQTRNSESAASRRGAVGANVNKPIRIIVAPDTCYLPEELRLWGWAVQIYATRSRASWGIGDLSDLRTLGTWAKELGAGCMMVNPLTAATPVMPLEASPYYPSSRRYRNPLYIRVEEAPAAEELGELLVRLGNCGRGLNDRRRIERDAVFALKMQALEACFARAGSNAPEFERYRLEQGRALNDFATYAALSERHGRDWRRWPDAVRHPDAAGIASFAHEHAPRIAFHAWLQWVLDQQLARASRELRIIQDLPIGLDVAGADAWCWQDLLAQGVSVGVPPDEFNPAGQDWGLTPFIPHKLRGAGYQPFIETIRATLRHAGGLRIDHVMGLFHLFWIPPQNGGATNGGYVRTRADELLGIIALESRRANAFVVGEDLGTVEPGVRETMATNHMLSYRLMYFEPGLPAEYPEMALSTVTTHDLPTIAGIVGKADLPRAKAAGAPQNEEGLATLRQKVIDLAGASPDSTPQAVIAGAYRALASAPSRVLLATLDDALAVEERPNIPAARTDWPNWSIALPLPLEDFAQQDLPKQIAGALSRPSLDARTGHPHPVPEDGPAGLPSAPPYQPRR